MAELLVPFFVIVAAFVSAGVATISASQHGTADHAGFWDVFFHDNIVSQSFGVAKKAARSLISRYAAAHLKLLTAWLNGHAQLWKEQFTATRRFARAANRLANTTERAIPRVAHKAAAPALARAKVADRHATHALAQGHVTARELHRFRTTTRARLKADAHAIDVTIPNDIAGLRRRTREVEDAQAKDRTAIGEIEHGATKTWDWIKSHPLGLASAAFAGAVAVALGRLGLGGLRCNNLKNLLKKRGCGVWSGLEGLLAAVAAFGLAADFRDVVKAAVAVEGEASAALGHLATLDDAAIMDAAKAVAKSANSIAGA